MTLTPEQVKEARAAATPGGWTFVESMSPDGQEWMGCGVEAERGPEFIWFEGDPEVDVPRARLIAMAPDMADLIEAQAKRIAELEGAIEFIATARSLAGCQRRARAALSPEDAQ